MKIKNSIYGVSALLLLTSLPVSLIAIMSTSLLSVITQSPTVITVVVSVISLFTCTALLVNTLAVVNMLKLYATVIDPDRLVKAINTQDPPNRHVDLSSRIGEKLIGVLNDGCVSPNTVKVSILVFNVATVSSIVLNTVVLVLSTNGTI